MGYKVALRTPRNHDSRGTEFPQNSSRKLPNHSTTRIYIRFYCSKALIFDSEHRSRYSNSMVKHFVHFCTFVFCSNEIGVFIRRILETKTRRNKTFATTYFGFFFGTGLFFPIFVSDWASRPLVSASRPLTFLLSGQRSGNEFVKKKNAFFCGNLEIDWSLMPMAQKLVWVLIVLSSACIFSQTNVC